MDTALEHKPASRPSANRVGWRVLVPVALALLAILLFANTFQHELMESWDDNRYIEENDLIRDLSPAGIARMFSQYYFAAYIPVTLLTYSVEYHLWGLHPSGYHVVNVLLHAANGVLVYYFLARLLNKRWVALLAAVLFIVHPLQVESVAWVAQRKNLLSMTFTLLSFLTHMQSARPGATRWMLPLTWLLYLLAALSKPAVVGVPLLFVAYDVLWAKMSIMRAVLRNLVPLAIAGGSAVLTVIAHEDVSGIKTYRGGSPLVMAQVMAVVFWEYVESLFVPTNLNNFYQYDLAEISFTSIKVWLGIAVAVFTLVFAWRQPLGRPVSLFAMLWVWLFMAPVSNIIPIAIERADRYMYFPLVMIFALIALLAERIWRLTRNEPQRLAISALAGFLVIPLLFLTVQRNEVWRTEAELWKDHVQDYPRSQTGWLNMGVYYYNTGRYDEGKVAFQTLLNINPSHFKGNRFMGAIAIQEDRFEDAVAYYQRAAQTDPSDATTYNNIAYAYFEMGNWSAAVEQYQLALELDPTLTRAYANMGTAALRTGDYALAREALTEAVARDEDHARSHSDLCTALSNLGDVKSAVTHCQRATQLAPEDGLYLGRYAHVLLMDGQADEALPVAQQAVAIAPDLSLSHRVLGEAYVALGQTEQGIAALEQALVIDPSNRRAQDLLASASS